MEPEANAAGLEGRGPSSWWKRHAARILCAVTVGVVLLWIALPSPEGAGVFGSHPRTALQPGRGPNGTVQFDHLLEFVNYTYLPLATVSGDVQLNVTGNWSASEPTWVWRGWSEFYSVPECYPYCGNSSEAGVINWGETFCTNWPGGGTSYPLGQENLTAYAVFWTLPDSGDTVSVNLTTEATTLSACPEY